MFINLQARRAGIASNLANVFYNTECRHIEPEVLILLTPHFSKHEFDLTVQINVLVVVSSDVWQKKKYKQSIYLINIEVQPYETIEITEITKARRERNLSIYKD